MSAGRRTGPHPALFFVLILPYGASFGFASVALPYLATQRGVPAGDAAAVVALAFVPHAWKFLWAPLVDTTLGPKRWYAIALAGVVLGTIASTAMPIGVATLGALTGVVVASQLGLTLMAMACELLLGHAVPDAEKGRAAGWYQAGMLAGVGVGGFAILELAKRLPQGWMTGAAVGVAMLPCALPLLALSAAGLEPRRLSAAIRALGTDLLALVRSRAGLTGLIIALSPVGASSVGNLVGVLTRDFALTPETPWHFLGFSFDPESVVGLVLGGGGGMLSALGAMAGGWLADRMNRRLAYALAGGTTALVSLAMAFAPRTPGALIGLALLWNLCYGVAFASFCAFVLDTVGRGAVATKYNVFASLGNQAIAYMSFLDGRGYQGFGPAGLFLTDAALTSGGIVLLLAMTGWLRRRDARSAASSSG